MKTDCKQGINRSSKRKKVAKNAVKRNCSNKQERKKNVILDYKF